jgi:hypothetical protein
MSNIIKVTNDELFTSVSSSGVIDIIQMDEENLKAIGWLDENCWPQGDFLQVISDLDDIFPTDFEHGAKFWDQISKGYSVYNNFLEDGNE